MKLYSTLITSSSFATIQALSSVESLVTRYSSQSFPPAFMLTEASEAKSNAFMGALVNITVDSDVRDDLGARKQLEENEGWVEDEAYSFFSKPDEIKRE